jgi:WD40 repeat protein
MEIPSGAVVGTLGIGAVVLAGIWYGCDAGLCEWTSPFAAQRQESRSNIASAFGMRVEWSANGQTLLVVSRNGADAKGRITLHDLSRPDLSTAVDVEGEYVHCTSPGRDGYFLAATGEGRLWSIDGTTGEITRLAESPVPQPFHATAVAPGGSVVAAGTSKGSVYLCEPAGLRATPLPTVRTSAINDLCFSGDGALLLSGSGDGTIALWDAKTRGLVQEFTGHGQPAMAVACLRNRRVMSVGLDDTTRIWNIETGREEWRGQFGLNGVLTLAVSRDLRTAAWGGFDSRVVVWDLEREQKQFEIRTPMSVVAHLRFSPNGTLLAVAGKERFIRIYDVHTGAESLATSLDSVDR